MEISGKTEDEKLVVKGIFPVVNSIGFPLECVVDTLKKQNMLVDWIDFYLESLTCNWVPERTLERIRLAVGDVYGPGVGDETLKRLKFYIAHKEIYESQKSDLS